jgi:molybdenum cofactor cytidylyltransferase
MPAERAGSVAGILLAAGASTRMGSNKLLFTLEGEPMVHRAARRALEAGLDPVIVVLGHEAERVREALEGLDCLIALNPEHTRGVNRSLKAGMAELPPAACATVVMLADMPYVTSAMIESMVARYRTGSAPLVISDYQGTNAPPMLYDRALFLELGAMEGEGCGRQVVRRHRAEADVISWPADALADVDVPADYERMRDASGGLT